MDNEERTYPGARGRRRRVTRAAVAAALLLTAVSASARGVGGDLDPTFGDGGKVVTEVGTVEDRAHAVVTQPDGKIVLAGHSYGGPTADFALVRYNADGSLDGAFGVGGEVVTDLDDSHDGARALVRQPDGKLVAAGSASKGNDHSALALTRYNDDGTLDDTFGVGGKVTTTFAPYVVNGNDLVLQPDGKLVVAGDIGPGPDVALARYNTDGSLDATFGNSGVVASDVYSDTSRTHAVAIQPDGKIVVGGYVTRLPNNDFILTRYKPDGSLDTSFGDAGSLTTDVSGHDLLNDLAVQSDGRIIAVGTSGAGFAIVRYNVDGTLDSTYGIGGRTTTDIGSGADQAQAVALQPDGKAVVAGRSVEDSVHRFGVARYAVDGTLDATFGAGGTVTTAVEEALSEAQAVALQSDGKVVAAGSSSDGVSRRSFAVVRYEGDAQPSPETCDGVDNDGDGSVDDGFSDADLDGSADCVDADDDNDGASDVDEINAGSDPLSGDSAPEVCDGADNDGDGSVDEGFADTDGDGTGDDCDPVTYRFTGVSAPVDNPPVINVSNAGRTVPVKYQLTALDGAPITDSSSFVRITSAKVSCGTLESDGSDALENYSGASGVQYLGDGYWQVNWATPKSYSSSTQGPCRVLTLSLADGSTHTANFRFK